MIITEGFKSSSQAKLVLFRAGVGRNWTTKISNIKPYYYIEYAYVYLYHLYKIENYPLIY